MAIFCQKREALSVNLYEIHLRQRREAVQDAHLPRIRMQSH
jgi:hypothetical protein